MVCACTETDVKGYSHRAHSSVPAGTSEGLFGDQKDSLCAESVAQSWWVAHWGYVMGQPVTCMQLTQPLGSWLEEFRVFLRCGDEIGTFDDRKKTQRILTRKEYGGQVMLVCSREIG